MFFARILVKESDFHEVMITLGKVIKEKRQLLRLSQRDLGEKSGRPYTTINRLEVGAVGDCHLGVLYDIAGALESDLTTLVRLASGNSTSSTALDWSELKNEIDNLPPSGQQWVLKMIREALEHPGLR